MKKTTVMLLLVAVLSVIIGALAGWLSVHAQTSVMYFQPLAGTTVTNCGTPTAGAGTPLCGTAAGWYVWNGTAWVLLGTPQVAGTVTINGKTGTTFTISATATAPVITSSATPSTITVNAN